jgi:glycosyltransferase domain-containing protein
VSLNNLTIYIPTKNRSQFLKRALDYYSLVNYDGKILIGDSSCTAEMLLNKENIKKNKNLDIEYHHFTFDVDYHDALKTYRLLNHIKTPYITFAGDDDFQIPNGLRQCVDFLEKNLDFTSAHGDRLNFTIDNPVYGNMVDITIHQGYDWSNEENPLRRWQEYLRTGIATTMHVHRTNDWKKYYRYSYKAKSNYIANELIPCSLCSLLGKTKRLNCLSVAFQRNNPVRSFSFVNTTLWDLIHKEQWIKSVEYFEEAVVYELSKTTGKQKAKEIFYKEFWYHCLLVMNSQFNRKYGNQEIEQKKSPIDLSSLTEDDDLYFINKVVSNC